MATKRNTTKRARAPHSYSMPELSELFPQPPYEYRDSTMLLVQFETDARVLRRLVPPPLTPNKDNVMSVSIAEFMCSGFGHYYEAHVFTQATFQRRMVNFSLYLILDNDIAIGAGREIWGFPKKLGRLTMDLTDDVVRGTVERGGITLIDAAVHLKTFAPIDTSAGTSEWIARKFVPSVTNGAPPDVDQLTSTVLTNTVVRESYHGDATVQFTPSPADKLHTIPVKKVLGGLYYRTDFTLEDGVVAHDYLA